jgi:hypothetical protein
MANSTNQLIVPYPPAKDFPDPACPAGRSPTAWVILDNDDVPGLVPRF